MLWVTLALTVAFINFQFQGFSEIISSGYYFTGAESSITTSFFVRFSVASLGPCRSRVNRS